MGCRRRIVIVESECSKRTGRVQFSVARVKYDEEIQLLLEMTLHGRSGHVLTGAQASE